MFLPTISMISQDMIKIADAVKLAGDIDMQVQGHVCRKTIGKDGDYKDPVKKCTCTCRSISAIAAPVGLVSRRSSHKLPNSRAMW